MKKKNIKALASLVTAVVVLIGGYIYKNVGMQIDNIPQSTELQSSSMKDNAQSTELQSSSAKDPQISEVQSDSAKNPQSTESQSSSATETKEQSNEEQSDSPNKAEKLEKTTFPESIIKIQKKGLQPFGYINAYVEKVVDGDTFHIKYGNEEYKVRMLDIDTPESIKSGVDAQPYALEASELTKNTLTGHNIKLVFEKDTTDQYERLLAHVILEDGTYYNALMVQNGYAISVFYSPNTLFKDYFAKLQNTAIENKAGFWNLLENDRPFVKNSKGKYIAAYKLKEDAAA
jgi:micrococcal nuclease